MNFRVMYHCVLMAKFDYWSEEIIKIADNKIDDKYDQERMIPERKWSMSKEHPRKYGRKAPLPPPPPRRGQN